MLLAHLLSGLGASQSQVVAREGSTVQLADVDTTLRIRTINMDFDYYGYVTDWRVGVEYLYGGEEFREDTISPNNPSLFKGFNINVINLQAYPVEVVLLQINREPGAVWALAGSVLFMLGIVTLITLRVKTERLY